MHLADMIGGLNRKIEQTIEAKLKAHGLTIVQFRVLKRLATENGIPMGDLASKVFVDSPTLTKIIDRMVTSADVYRGPDPQDRRRVLIFISKKGRSLYDQLHSIDEGMEHDLTGGLEDDERQAFVKIMLALLAETAGSGRKAQSMQPAFGDSAGE